VLCLETLEHVEFVRRAIAEMHRVLMPGGFCIITTVMNGKIHNYPSDYWRFTPAGLSSLLRPFKSQHVSWVGTPKFPHSVYGIGAKHDGNWQARLRRNPLPPAGRA
jgi:2-polyprenyl-3-methyl-5-hydroxy-6-metoxy-1,4-benzoquinol methylase